MNYKKKLIHMAFKKQMKHAKISYLPWKQQF